jgi:hypothetical protein
MQRLPSSSTPIVPGQVPQARRRFSAARAGEYLWGESFTWALFGGAAESVVTQMSVLSQLASTDGAVCARVQDYVVVGSDSGRFSVLEYQKDKNRLAPVQLETFGKSGCRRIVPGQYVVVDPKGRAAMIGSMEKQKVPAHPPTPHTTATPWGVHWRHCERHHPLCVHSPWRWLCTTCWRGVQGFTDCTAGSAHG